MPITLLDGILVGFTLVSAMLAMVRGFSREVLSVISWIAAAAAAFFFYQPVLPYVQPYVDNEKIAMVVAAGIVFIVALIVVSIITMKLADWIIDSRVGALDRTLGFLYGAARGILVVAVALLFFNWLAGPKAPGWVADAKSRPLLESIGAKLESLLPEDPE
ncbi:MAG: CvpA family protein, partial [Mesorhizobium sp.]